MHHDRDTLQKMHDDRYARTNCTFWREPFSLFVIKEGHFSTQTLLPIKYLQPFPKGVPIRQGFGRSLKPGLNKALRSWHRDFRPYLISCA